MATHARLLRLLEAVDVGMEQVDVRVAQTQDAPLALTRDELRVLIDFLTRTRTDAYTEADFARDDPDAYRAVAQLLLGEGLARRIDAATRRRA